MTQDHRTAVVTALIGLAASDVDQDRADAGRALATFADTANARETLLQLVLDPNDTFVTLTTSEALLRRQDLTGFRIVAEALSTADDQHRTYVDDAVAAVFIYAADRDRAVQTCDALSLEASTTVRAGAGVFRNMLTEVHPLLYPQSPA